MKQPIARVFVKPAEGKLCRRPPEEGCLMLPAEGAEVRLTMYWRRRLQDGDVMLVDTAPDMAPTLVEDPKPTRAKRAAKEE